jgi:hypothetical protein
LALLAIACRSADRPHPSIDKGAANRGALIVSYAPDSADTFTTAGAESLLVLDWLRRACDSARVHLEVKEYPFGVLINGIGARRNGEAGNWLYKVNGRMMARAASGCLVSPDDTVLFFFQ